jgi:hypothetical protein
MNGTDTIPTTTMQNAQFEHLLWNMYTVDKIKNVHNIQFLMLFVYFREWRIFYAFTTYFDVHITFLQQKKCFNMFQKKSIIWK